MASVRARCCYAATVHNGKCTRALCVTRLPYTMARVYARVVCYAATVHNGKSVRARCVLGPLQYERRNRELLNLIHKMDLNKLIYSI
jgi:hypothetical protein